MSPLALGLVLLSVCLHAGWNLLGKRRTPSLAFFVLAMGSGALVLSPLLWLGPPPTRLPAAFWGWLAASGLCQMLYMGGLAWAYAGLRIVHSLWQCLVNKIPPRVMLFFVSSLCLLGLAINAVRATLL